MRSAESLPVCFIGAPEEKTHWEPNRNWQSEVRGIYSTGLAVKHSAKRQSFKFVRGTNGGIANIYRGGKMKSDALKDYSLRGAQNNNRFVLRI